MPDRNEQLSLAIGSDGIVFEKTEPNPFAAPEQGYQQRHYRDPFVFRDEQTGEFNMLVTAALAEYPIAGGGGCLLRLTSQDLRHWHVAEPFLIPGGVPGYRSVPECPDYFHWKGWYYLIFSLDGIACYRMSQEPQGPWLRPAVDTFDGSNLALVMKTAAFTGNRRIGVAYFGSRRDNKDDGTRMYGGNALFRELVQHADGTLGTRFPAEMTPAAGEKLDLSCVALTQGVSGDSQQLRIEAQEGLGVAALENVPRNVRIAFTVQPEGSTAVFGLWLRASGDFDNVYRLHFLPYEHKVTLNSQVLTSVSGLDQAFTVEIIAKDDFIDVCIDGRRCLIDRCPELQGEGLFFFCQNGAVSYDSIEIAPLL